MTWSQEKLFFSTDFKDLSIQHTRAEIILTDMLWQDLERKACCPHPPKAQLPF